MDPESQSATVLSQEQGVGSAPGLHMDLFKEAAPEIQSLGFGVKFVAL